MNSRSIAIDSYIDGDTDRDRHHRQRTMTTEEPNKIKTKRKQNIHKHSTCITMYAHGKCEPSQQEYYMRIECHPKRQRKIYFEKIFFQSSAMAHYNFSRFS